MDIWIETRDHAVLFPSLAPRRTGHPLLHTPVLRAATPFHCAPRGAARPSPAPAHGGILGPNAARGVTALATGEYRPGTVEEEFKQAFANIVSIARAAGFGLDELVSVHVALGDIGDYQAVNGVYREAFADVANLPARLTYQAGALPFGCKVELQAIAARA